VDLEDIVQDMSKVVANKQAGACSGQVCLPKKTPSIVFEAATRFVAWFY